MGELIGMDPDVVRGLAAKLNAQASAIRGTIGTLDGIVHHLSQLWSGPSAVEFIGGWHQHYRPALSSAAEAIEGLATVARNNATQQDRASDAQPSQASRSDDRPSVGRSQPSLWHAGLSAFGLGASLVAHDIKGEYGRVVNAAEKDKHEIANDLKVLAHDPRFQSAVKWSGRIAVVTNLVTPFLAGIPVVGEVAMAANFDVNAFHLAGEALEMKEGVEPMDTKQLAFDGVGTVFAFTDVAGVTAVAPSMSKDVLGVAPGLNLGKGVGEVFKDNFSDTAKFSEAVTGLPQDVSKAAQVAKLAFGGVQAVSNANDIRNEMNAGDGYEAGANTLLLTASVAGATGVSL